MNRKLQFLGVLSLAASLYGCSVLRELSADQCKVDGDCARFGDYECSSENVCVARTVTNGGSNTGGSSTSGGGGKGGEAPMGCESNAECIDAHEGAPYICQEGSCVSLTLPEHCPFVVAGPEPGSTEYLTKAGKPIIFGAYVPIDVASPESHPYTLNYKFALQEFMDGTQGGVGQPARPFVMVMCQSSSADLKASAAHLVDTLQVPAILATLSSTQLVEVFDEVTLRNRPVFLLGPFEADSALTVREDAGRMWHMLGPATDLIPAYVPLLQHVESYVRNVMQPTDLEPSDKLKVAVVHSDLTYSIDMANQLARDVSVNGYKLNADENDGYYKRLEVKVTGDDPLDVTGVTGTLKQFSAHIVISLGGPEFIDPILPEIQYQKTVGTSPFYILSPRNSFDSTLTNGTYLDLAGLDLLDVISAGVNYASVEDSTLYDEYLDAIQARYEGQSGLESRENLYDAAYFMLYALAAASFTGEDFDGDDVVNGMKALIDGTEAATVGPGNGGAMFSKVLSVLRNGGKVALTGTLGPPNFNPLTGARKSPGSIWCLEEPGVVHFDMLRLVEGPPPSFKLSQGKSEFCYANFFPTP
jgi:hypothetical protein